ncbi:MAG TPA: L-seryl-tRNA(Sec) selenium transferase [Gammaproteobacteria bacterium]|nr:L-seryl-tRNA(Sec) selenium transferase [Gammaproteobacteria bacterium]
MNLQSLREIPSVDRWLGTPAAQRLCSEYARPAVAAALREELEQVRRAAADGHTELPDFAAEDFEAAIRARLEASLRSGLHKVINATGVILHTNLGRAPLCEAAIAAIDAHADGYSNLELDLNTGKRGSRNSHAAAMLCEITGAEDALVVNNCAAALVLVLARFCRGKRVVISRGELIEIGGSFRMPDVIAESGAVMTEVGTTNRTSLQDYRTAIDADTAILLASHPSNYRVVGFSGRPALAELAELATARHCLSVLDLGSGCLVDLSAAGFAKEPSVGQCLRAGVDLVTFSGDKLLGGPQAGIVVGRRELIEPLRGSPLARAMRIDKLSLTALVATLRQYLPPNDPFAKIPVLRMLTEQTDSLLRRANEAAQALRNVPELELDVIHTAGLAGGGTLPVHELPGAALRVRSRSLKVDVLAERLRLGTPAVIGHIRDDALLLDLRTVAPSEEAVLISRLRAVCESANPAVGR